MRASTCLRRALYISATIVAIGCKTSNSGPGEVSQVQDSPPEQEVKPTPADKFDCSVLDYGIYWYGKGNVAQKAKPSQNNRFFDKTRPTVLYVHGWQKDSHKNLSRENFLFTNPLTGKTEDLASSWIDANWNIGVFYWNQFADEEDVTVAEGKIWSPATAKLKWKKCDGTLATEGAPSGSIADIFYRSVEEAMDGFEGPQFRVVGHSLGSQVAARGSFLLLGGVESKNLPAGLRPTRLAQLDPYWSKGEKGKPWPGNEVRGIAEKTVKGGLLWEMYKTSALLKLGGDTNLPLEKLIGYSTYIPSFIADKNYLVQEGMRHVWAPKVYFMSFAASPPPACPSNATCKLVARSAATSDEQTLELMKGAVAQRQVKGLETPTTKDDAFELAR